MLSTQDFYSKQSKKHETVDFLQQRVFEHQMEKLLEIG